MTKVTAKDVGWMVYILPFLITNIGLICFFVRRGKMPSFFINFMQCESKFFRPINIRVGADD